MARSSAKTNGEARLSPASEEAFQLITKQYTMTPDSTLVLLGALHNYDRYCEARAAVTKHGLLLKDASGALRKNPACAVEAQAYSNFLAGMRFLSLDATAEELLPRREGPSQGAQGRTLVGVALSGPDGFYQDCFLRLQFIRCAMPR